MLLAFILLAVGIAFLGLNMGFISSSTFNILWPLLLVFFGVWLLMEGRSAWHCSLGGKKKKSRK